MRNHYLDKTQTILCYMRLPELIAKSITDIAVTNIIPQNDHLQTKAKEVNARLARLCKKIFFFVDRPCK